MKVNVGPGEYKGDTNDNKINQEFVGYRFVTHVP